MNSERTFDKAVDLVTECAPHPGGNGWPSREQFAGGVAGNATGTSTRDGVVVEPKLVRDVPCDHRVSYGALIAGRDSFRGNVVTASFDADRDAGSVDGWVLKAKKHHARVETGHLRFFDKRELRPRG